MNKYDVNKDGVVTERDATMITTYISGLANFVSFDINNDGEVNMNDYHTWRAQFDFADIDRNGKLDDADVVRIQNAIVNLIDKENSMDINQDGEINTEDATDLDKLIKITYALNRKLDITGDGIITEADGIILNKIIEVCQEMISRMDVNKDGKINLEDATKIQQNKD